MTLLLILNLASKETSNKRHTQKERKLKQMCDELSLMFRNFASWQLFKNSKQQFSFNITTSSRKSQLSKLTEFFKTLILSWFVPERELFVRVDLWYFRENFMITGNIKETFLLIFTNKIIKRDSKKRRERQSFSKFEYLSDFYFHKSRFC